MKIIVVDSNALAYRAKYSMIGLSHNLMQTGVIFGFLAEVLRLAQKFETSKFAFAWDSKESIRRIIYPLYKHKRRERVKTSEEQYLDQVSFEQFTLIRKYVLPMFGFKNVFLRRGYEGDDIIANILVNNPRKDFVIVSNDEDLYQLLDFAPIYSLKHKKLYTKDDFEKEYNILPDNWVDVKAIAGCSTDSVEGIKGVGPKTAIKYLKRETKDSVSDNIMSNHKIIKRNFQLVDLPLVVDNEEMTPIRLSFRGERFAEITFYNLCKEYDFQSFIRSAPLWIRTFKMVDASGN